MKRIIVIMLALMLALLSGTAVFAQTETETETENVITWSEIEEYIDLLGLTGDFYELGDFGIKMWIPEQLQESELSEEEIADGYVFYLATEEEDAIVSGYVAQVEEATLEDYKDYLDAEEDVSGVEIGFVNGIQVVSYFENSSDIMAVAMLTDANYMLEISFWPHSDEEFQTVASIMASSIQVIE